MVMNTTQSFVGLEFHGENEIEGGDRMHSIFMNTLLCSK